MRTKSPKKNKINIVTLGCSKNIYDSEVLMGQLKANGKEVAHESKGNIVVVNTCGFIDNAKEESVNTILEYAKQKESGLIDKLFVTGCLSERYKDNLEKEISQVDQFFGTTDLPLLLKSLGADYKKELVGERLLTTPRHYAYLKIAEGCDRPCSFCAIPLMRGQHLSKTIEELVDETKKLATKGVSELILIAQDLTYYGLDLYKKRRLADLLKELCKVEGIQWIRLHYAFPTGFPMDVIEIMKANPKICNYLDIPLQHISDNILKSMRRGTTKEKTDELIREIRQQIPNITIRTSLIIGYPGETEEDFNILKQWVKDTRFDRLGCFKYSHEENTYAYQLEDNVPEEVKKNRIDEIMDIQGQISWEMNQTKVKQTLKCVIDRKEGTNYIGRTESDSPDVDNEVLINHEDHQHLRIGEYYDVLINEASDYDLLGEVIL